jgi:hypothetical protein
MIPPVDTFQNLTNQLQAGLNFLPDDLEANERGVLSERQQHALLAVLAKMPRDVGSGCRLLFLALPLVFVALLIVLFIAVEGNMARALLSAIITFLKQPDPLVLAIIALPLLIMVLSTIRSSRIKKKWRSEMRMLEAAPDKAVLLVEEGTAHRRWISAGRHGLLLYIVINRKWLRVNVFKGDEYEAFQNGVTYRVYYLNLGRIPYLLSAKVLSNT